MVAILPKSSESGTLLFPLLTNFGKSKKAEEKR
jgi:hypothetical protein